MTMKIYCLICLMVYYSGLTTRCFAQAGTTQQAGNRTESVLTIAEKRQIRKQQVAIAFRTASQKGYNKQREKMLTGAWAYTRDTLIASRSIALLMRQSDKMIPDADSSRTDDRSGKIFYEDHTGVRYHISGTSVFSIEFYWSIRGDTLTEAEMPSYYFGDTVITCFKIPLQDQNSFAYYQLSHTNISEPFLCEEKAPGRLAYMQMSRPRFSGNLRKYFDDTFSDFTPEKDHYSATLKCSINCKGEVTAVPPAGNSVFECHLYSALKKMGYWIPAAYQGVHYDAQIQVNASWDKGFLNVEFSEPNY